MKVLEIESKGGADYLRKRSRALSVKLKHEKQDSERQMLLAAYNLMERKRTVGEDIGMRDFEQFKRMLPPRMKASFLEKTDFDTIVNDKSIVEYDTFVDMIDLYAQNTRSPPNEPFA